MSRLDRARELLAKSKSSELHAEEQMPDIKDLREQISALRTEMYAEKKKAAEEASAPYLKAIDELETQIAFMISIVS